MKIISTKPLYKASKGSRTFLTMHQVTFEHKDRTSDYFMVGRGENLVPHAEKRPDAVVVVATHVDASGDIRLLMTSEFRVPIGVREFGFPAGLIEDKDYEGGVSHRVAAERTAIRETKEETGLDLLVTSTSPANLYSSAGLTNESISYVFGQVNGSITDIGLEPGEDISAILISREEATRILYQELPDIAHSKSAWPWLWAFANGHL